MAQSKPPARPSKPPSKAPSAKASSSWPPKGKPSKAPPRRQTMEVQLAWLELEDSAKKSSAPTVDVQPEWLEEPAAEPVPEAPPPPSSRKKPPRLPGAALTLPPMPVLPSKRPPPARHRTMEVEMNWLEILDETKKRKASERPAPVDAALKRPNGKKPIPREDD